MLLRVATFAVLAVLAVPVLSGRGSSTKAASTQKAVRELKEENEQHSEEQNTKAEELKEEQEHNAEEQKKSQEELKSEQEENTEKLKSEQNEKAEEIKNNVEER